MEIFCVRFPIASKMVLNDLDNTSLLKTKEASSKVSEFLDKDRFFWIRILKKYSEHFIGK